jgi:excinuclease ABC subunit C
MMSFAKIREFEKANELKKQIFSLEHIQDVALIREPLGRGAPKRQEFRIEAYDIAHISGTSVAGAVAVIENGEVKKSDYRKFKIKSADRRTKGGDDISALKEILKRRLKHKEWRLPNLIVVDGGAAQRNAAESILKEFELKIPVAGVVKDKRHKPSKVFGLPGQGPRKEIEEYKKRILLANSEAHRFALQYHKKLRSRLK